MGDGERRGEHERHAGEVDGERRAVEVARHAGAQRRGGDPHREIESDEERIIERRCAEVRRAHRHEEREARARHQVAVERLQVKLHSARVIASMRRSSMSRGMSAGVGAAAAIAPASTAAAAV